MGSDTLYLSPCCQAGFIVTTGAECVCDACGEMFNESRAIENIIDYQDEEVRT